MANKNILEGPITPIAILDNLVTSPFPVWDAGGTLTVDGQVGASQVGTWSANTTTVRKTILAIAGTVNASGNNTIIAAPASGNQIYIVGLKIQNESAVSTTAILRNDTTDFWRHVTTSTTNFTQLSFPEGRELPVGNAKALLLNLNGANSVNYSIIYFVDAV